MSKQLLEVKNLFVQFGNFTAVKDVSFTVAPGETIGLVGESGSGKSTIGNAILGLTKPRSGSIAFDGSEVVDLNFARRRALSEHLQVVFQDPYSSLNPSRTIAQTLAEPLLVHASMSKQEMSLHIGAMLEKVGLKAADASKYPVAFSGGQRQRIAIARALMLKPKLVVCDEPVSGLDLSTQAQVLNLLKDLQAEMGLALLFVSHDLAVVRYMSHRIVVLRQGEVVETGTAQQVYDAPRHDYTRMLLDASPVPDPAAQARRRAERLRAAQA